MWELLLRLWGLSTFVHEVAHHDDAMRRVARGRWRMAVKKKVEDYADTLQAEWARDVVVPYLERAYPAEVALLNAWMARHGGLALRRGQSRRPAARHHRGSHDRSGERRRAGTGRRGGRGGRRLSRPGSGARTPR
jgi:hypothetical protein